MPDIHDNDLEQAKISNTATDQHAEIIRDLKRIFVTHPAVESIRVQLNRLFHYGNAGRLVNSPARCLLLTGRSGSGKSALLEEWANRHPVVDTEEGYQRPVVYVSVINGCTPKGLAELILRALGVEDNLISRGTVATLMNRVKANLRHQGTRVVILDEFQNLINSEKRTVLHKTADSVKELLNDGATSYVCAGVAQAAAVFAANEQLQRRSMANLKLLPFDWENSAERDQFQAILDHYEQSLPFQEPSYLGTTDTALRIHHVSNGLLGRAIDFVIAATIHALETGSPSLTHEVFRATNENMRNDFEHEWFNVFDDIPIENMPPVQLAEEPAMVLRGGRRQRQPREADLLTAA